MSYNSKEKQKDWYLKNKEKVLAKAKERYELKREEIKKKNRERYYRKREQILEQCKEYRNNHREECLRRAKRWAKENPEKRRAIVRRHYEKKLKEDPEWGNKRARKYYHRNIEESRKKLRKYRKENPIKTRYWKYKRRVRCDFTGVDKEHMTEDFKRGVLKILEEQDYKCLYCGRDVSEDYSLDHRIPLSRGGKNTVENIDIVCKDCNTKKSTRTKKEYLKVLEIADGL